MARRAAPTCLGCGACCIANDDGDRYVDLDAEDVARLPARYRLRVVGHDYAPSLATKRTRDGTTCCALQGRVGTTARCAIYGRRPTVCRAFEPGDYDCLRARREAGLEENRA